jgi:hypothetical protein
MAKRFNVSIPDALAERMEPFKSSLSLSSLMQNAIEQELIRLTTTDEKRDLMAQFKRAAVGAWFSRLPGLGEALDDFAQSLIDKAAKDGDRAVFRIYRNLFFSVKGKEVLLDIERFYGTVSEEPIGILSLEITEEINAVYGAQNAAYIQECKHALESIADQGRNEFGTEFVAFLEKRAQEGIYCLGQHNYVERLIEGKQRLSLNEDLATEMGCDAEPDATIERIYFESLDSRIREMMSPEDIKLFVTDFNLAFVRSEKDI